MKDFNNTAHGCKIQALTPFALSFALSSVRSFVESHGILVIVKYPTVIFYSDKSGYDVIMPVIVISLKEIQHEKIPSATFINQHQLPQQIQRRMLERRNPPQSEIHLRNNLQCRPRHRFFIYENLQ